RRLERERPARQDSGIAVGTADGLESDVAGCNQSHVGEAGFDDPRSAAFSAGTAAEVDAESGDIDRARVDGQTAGKVGGRAWISDVRIAQIGPRIERNVWGRQAHPPGCFGLDRDQWATELDRTPRRQ